MLVSSLSGELIAVIVLSAAVVVFGVLTAVLYGKMKRAVNAAKKENGEETAPGVKVRGGVRYSTDDAIRDDDGIRITLGKGDVQLARNVEYRVGSGGLMPGSYTALSAARTVRPSSCAWPGSCANTNTATRSSCRTATRSPPFRTT